MSPLIGDSAWETMRRCKAVLAFLADYHLRESDNVQEQQIEHREMYVIEAVQDALSKQMDVMGADNG